MSAFWTPGNRESRGAERGLADFDLLDEVLAQLNTGRPGGDKLIVFAAGKKGVHCEVPVEIFMTKIAKGGLTGLPAIYKELAFNMYVDTMDLRVYSARKGRMWRTCGVARENGNYKVPLTVAEATTMKAEDYAALVAAPRPAPAYAPAALSPKLAVMFEKAKLKVEAAVKRKKDSAKDLRLLADFKGAYPPTLERIMRGEGVAENAGFQQLAMQIAITSNAIMKSEEQMLAAAAGIIESHVSDGSRYNSPAKRRDELLRMHRYTSDNICYAYASGAIKKLSAPDIPTPDLSGIPASAGGVTEGAADDGGLSQGVFLSETGVWVKPLPGNIG